MRLHQAWYHQAVHAQVASHQGLQVDAMMWLVVMVASLLLCWAMRLWILEEAEKSKSRTKKLDGRRRK